MVTPKTKFRVISCLIACSLLGLVVLQMHEPDLPEQSVGPMSRVRACTCGASGSIRLKIFVFAWRRVESLLRLFRSMSAATYCGDEVLLEIVLDGNFSSNVLAESNRFYWAHGMKTITQLPHRLGTEAVWMRSWTPQHVSEVALFLEDDMELSTQFYLGIIHYVNVIKGSMANHIAGFSLYTPRLNEMVKPFVKWIPRDHVAHNAFLLQLPSSWAPVYLATHWKRIVAYYRLQKALEIDFGGRVGFKELHSYNWARSWKKYAVNLFILADWYMLHTNFEDQLSLATNFHERGEHTGANGQSQQPNENIVHSGDKDRTVPLVQNQPACAAFSVRSLPSFSARHEKLGTFERDYWATRRHNVVVEFTGLLLGNPTVSCSKSPIERESEH